MTMQLEIVSDVNAGFTVRRDGQEYTYIGDVSGEPRQLENGRVLSRLWKTRCKTCDEPFEFESDMDVTYMTRRCVPCRPWRNKK